MLLRVLKEVRPLDVQLISEQSLAELRGIFQYKNKTFLNLFVLLLDYFKMGYLAPEIDKSLSILLFFEVTSIEVA